MRWPGCCTSAFHPRPERCWRDNIVATDRASSPAISRQKNTVSASRSEFRWNQLLSFDACVQCGKCEAACPAFAAGQPLNPKKLIQDLVVGHGERDRRGLRRQPHARACLSASMAGAPEAAGTSRIDRSGHPVVLHDLPRLRARMPDADRACRCDRRHAAQSDAGAKATCRAKARDAGQSARDRQRGGLRHRRALRTGPSISKCAGRTTGRCRRCAADRRAKARSTCAISARCAHWSRSLKRAEVDFAVLGGWKLDTGDTARRLGDEATFQHLARRNVARLATLCIRAASSPPIRTCCISLRTNIARWAGISTSAASHDFPGPVDQSRAAS